MNSSYQELTTLSGNIVDLHASTIYAGTITISDGRITAITKDSQTYDTYILPGFIDAHIHVESSMLPPSEFARLAVVHGTVATISDPHEIANVMGTKGVEYMIEDGKRVPFTFIWGAPSCVPATPFETAGATLDAQEVEKLLQKSDIRYLSEVMNFPGVIHRDAQMMAKIAASQKIGKPVDGHAPGLMGEDLKKYVSAGISTDHESYMLAEAQEKLALGMKIIIREGSAAKNFDALHPLLTDHWQMCMFGSDDKHPNNLVDGHIDEFVRRSVELGYDTMQVLTCACKNPVEHYNLEVGQLKVGDYADCIIVNNLQEFAVQKTLIRGQLVAQNGTSLIPRLSLQPINNFATDMKKPDDFRVPTTKNNMQVRIIEALDGQLITKELHETLQATDGAIVPDIARDILKICVVNRYANAPISVGFIKNFGLKKGAIASTVAHDSHNIVAVGVDDNSLCKAVNLLIEEKGGISAVSETLEEVLPLHIAGLMSTADGHEVARSYTKLDALAKELGSTLTAPFMTLSFMALPVIPQLKITDKSLFDGKAFQPVSLETQ